jgi:uncharacterized membrane protein
LSFVVLGTSLSTASGGAFHAGNKLVSPSQRTIAGVADDGLVLSGTALVIGQSQDPISGEVAYRWTSHGGFVSLGKLPVDDVLGKLAPLATSVLNQTSSARAISGDGQTVVGSSALEFSWPEGRDWASQAFRWTQTTGMVPLGVLPGHEYSQALDVSGDGGVIVGFSEDVDPRVSDPAPPHWLTSLALTPFRWTEAGGLERLDLPAGYSRGLATKVSADGRVVAGQLQASDGTQSIAFRWTAVNGIQPLDPSTSSLVSDISADGSVLVGQVWNPVHPTYTQAFRWTAAGGLDLLESPLAEQSSTANAVSYDGSLVLGSYATDLGFRTYAWDTVHGMHDLQDLLAGPYGLGESLDGWQLTSVGGLSRDGRVVHGIGETPEGSLADWIAFLDQPLSLGPRLPGDFDHNGMVELPDIDLLGGAIRAVSTNPMFDLNASGLAELGDLDQLVHDILGTWYGDASLDGLFNSFDIVQVFQAGKYEDDQPLNASWNTGDWNLDGDFTSSDLVAAFGDGGYEQGPRPAAAAVAVAVPEPVSPLSLLLGTLILPLTRSRPK